ncbi:hypothetical protein JW851_00320 [Candidatus Woesearchaeota archaeon]|nr:hypothetical protein [Candidatus Woesearchaeota archaeon]
MTEQTKTVFFAIIALTGMMALFFTIGNNLETTGQSIGHTQAVNYEAQTKVTASGSFGGLGNGRASLSFSTSAGPATGTFSGEYESGPIQAIYNGQLSGTFAGGDGGTVSGTMSGRGQMLSGNLQQGWQPISGTFKGIISFSKGTVTGNWNGGQSGGQFNLRFTPIQGIQKATTPSTVTQYGVTTTQVEAPLGYCKCRTSRPYIVGVGGDPYGTSEGLDFKGFMTYQACQNTCPGRYVWRER